MGLSGYRNLRDANVWHRGINQLRSGNAAALKLAAMKSRRRKTHDAPAEPSAATASAPPRMAADASRRYLNTARRNLGLWRRGREFVQAALGLGRAVRRSVLARAAGGGRQAIQINLRNRARGLRSAARGEVPQTSNTWTQLSKQLKADGSLQSNTRRFRTRKLRRLNLRLLERALGKSKRSNRPEEIYRRKVSK